MKNVVIVSGSKRKGNTLGIANVYADELSKRGCHVHLIDLSSLKLEYCDGCLECDESQVCKYADEFGSIIESVRMADIIILGTPTRWRLLSGELKTFIDRLNPYAAVEGYTGGNAFIYAVGQSSKEEGISVYRAIESVCAFIEDSGMNKIGSQGFFDLYGATDYLNQLNDIKNICKENVDLILGVQR